MNTKPIALVGWLAFCALLSSHPLLTAEARAEQTVYSPNDIFSGVEYANELLDRILAAKGVSANETPQSHERSVKPMHVYELHVSALARLYDYALANARRPPPVVISTPIEYTPTDTYYLTELVIKDLESIYADNGGNPEDFAPRSHVSKSPSDVYQEIFELYYKLDQLNGQEQVSPNEVYAQILRAREDLQHSLLTLSKRLPDTDEDKKRLLVTAVYGFNPDGNTLPVLQGEKTPADVLVMAFSVRDKLNDLRKKYGMPAIARPEPDEFDSPKPVDVFLQTQILIAELNLLKGPLEIHSSTNSAKPTSDKRPADVYQEMQHIEYMLDRLMAVL